MLGLLRYQIFLVYGVAFLALWQGAKLNVDESTNATTTFIVNYAPIWGILLLGIYAATTIIHNVMTFNDCPGAAEELERQIKEAKAEMKKRKIIED